MIFHTFLVGAVSLYSLLFAMYSNHKIHVAGLSPLLAILLAEVFAIVFEAFYLSRLRRQDLNFKESLVLTSIANAASFLLGLMVF